MRWCVRFFRLVFTTFFLFFAFSKSRLCIVVQRNVAQADVVTQCAAATPSFFNLGCTFSREIHWHSVVFCNDIVARACLSYSVRYKWKWNFITFFVIIS